MANMDIQVEYMEPAYVIKLAGRWDAFSAPELERYLDQRTNDIDLNFVVLDLTNVDYVSSFGLRGLLNLGKKLERSSGALHISAMRPEVKRVFSGSGFETLFPSFTDVQTALFAFKNKNRS